MTSVTISLPESLKEFIDVEVHTKGYGNVSEYVRGLLRAQQASAADARLEALLLEGLPSGTGRTRSGRRSEIFGSFGRAQGHSSSVRVLPYGEGFRDGGESIYRGGSCGDFSGVQAPRDWCSGEHGKCKAGWIAILAGNGIFGDSRVLPCVKRSGSCCPRASWKKRRPSTAGILDGDRIVTFLPIKVTKK
jgi:putative addiction module CopG family antidote